MAGPAASEAWPVVGVFVGGQGRRMGGVPKGLLCHQGVPLIERVLGACRVAAAPRIVEHVFLVGNAVAYAASGLPVLADAPSGIGPIGGLRALLMRARELGLDALAVAVDLPYLEAALVRRLCLEQPDAAALAPRQEGRWQPLFARYRPSVVLPALESALDEGQSALQAIFRKLEAGPPGAAVGRGAQLSRFATPAELSLSPAEALELRDWDQPGDMDAGVPTS